MRLPRVAREARPCFPSQQLTRSVNYIPRKNAIVKATLKAYLKHVTGARKFQANVFTSKVSRRALPEKVVGGGLLTYYRVIAVGLCTLVRVCALLLRIPFLPVLLQHRGQQRSCREPTAASRAQQGTHLQTWHTRHVPRRPGFRGTTKRHICSNTPTSAGTAAGSAHHH